MSLRLTPASLPALPPRRAAATPIRRSLAVRSAPVEAAAVVVQEDVAKTAIQSVLEVKEGRDGVCFLGRRLVKPTCRANARPPLSPQSPPPPTPLYTPPTPGAAAATKFRLAFALPWRRFKSNSVLVIPLGGAIGDKRTGRFGSATTLPQITRALEKAAYDPRVSAVWLKIEPLSSGWAKLKEIRDYIALARASGKPVIAYLERGGEKEYYVACAADKVYMPDSAALSLRGIAVSGTFLRGVADKVGVSPDIVRIGKFKSAGDQLLRSGMADAQREALGAIADAVYDEFVSMVAASRGLSTDAVTAFLDEGAYAAPRFVESGIIDGLKYEDEVVEELRSLTGLPAPTPPRLDPARRPPPQSPRTAAHSDSKKIRLRLCDRVWVGGQAQGGRPAVEWGHRRRHLPLRLQHHGAAPDQSAGHARLHAQDQSCRVGGQFTWWRCVGLRPRVARRAAVGSCETGRRLHD